MTWLVRLRSAGFLCFGAVAMLVVANLLIAPFAATANGEDADYAAEIGAPPNKNIFFFPFAGLLSLRGIYRPKEPRGEKLFRLCFGDG